MFPAHQGDPRDRLSGFTCPECRGPLFRRDLAPAVSEFHCRVGHVFSPQVLLDEHTSAQEKRLYEALLALEEGADLAEYMAARMNGDQSAPLLQEAAQLRQYASGIRMMIEKRIMPPPEPSPRH